MNDLGRLLVTRIRADGPMRLSDYMAECLIHPAHGYYATRDPFGARGDFTTAPEISQMFGEMLGLCLAQSWLDQRAPSPFTLAEIGPGRGTLMADILRTIRAAPCMPEAARVHLVEASEMLRARQRETLAGTGISFHDRVETLPEAPLFLVANEFFDALPIRQFQRQGNGWRERVVGLDEEGNLAPALAPLTRYEFLERRIADTRDGDIVEVCPAAIPTASGIAGRIARHGGAALIVDYGGWHSLGDTFQALKAHQPVDPFAEPGEADLTAHVDFEPLAEAARAAGAEASAMVPQGVLLERLGITARAQRLAQGLEGERLRSHSAAHRRLTHPDEMGALFKVLAFHPKGSPPPPGLEPVTAP
ncbi:class I SAM-dependent methyltransferase [Ostreiculturibacter nitratireducens]|uniref:class I SAM-dependent methyltransferase n=1 Tax=Ostreiculturibacter nitratireducens TaxID=3075226 RepID=UPI0031B647A0